jgi:hypothetical protein
MPWCFDLFTLYIALLKLSTVNPITFSPSCLLRCSDKCISLWTFWYTSGHMRTSAARTDSDFCSVLVIAYQLKWPVGSIWLRDLYSPIWTTKIEKLRHIFVTLCICLSTYMINNKSPTHVWLPHLLLLRPIHHTSRTTHGMSSPLVLAVSPFTDLAHPSPSLLYSVLRQNRRQPMNPCWTHLTLILSCKLSPHGTLPLWMSDLTNFDEYVNFSIVLLLPLTMF